MRVGHAALIYGGFRSMILVFFRRKEYVITVDSRPGKGPGPAGHQGQAGAAARPPGVRPSEMTSRILELVTRDESAVLMLRWEAAGPGGQAVPGPGRRDHANPRRAARHPALAGRSLPARAACPARDPASRLCTGQRQRRPGRSGIAPRMPRHCPGPWPVARQEPGHHGLRGTRNALA